MYQGIYSQPYTCWIPPANNSQSGSSNSIDYCILQSTPSQLDPSAQGRIPFPVQINLLL